MKKAVLTIAIACLIATPMSFAHSQKTNSNEKSNATENHRVEARVNRRVDFLNTVLSLTQSQQEQARTIFTNAAKENAALFANLRTERQDLRKAVEMNESSSMIKKSSDAIGTDIGKIVANEANAFAQFRNTLTPEQQTKFSQLARETAGWGMGMSFYGARPFED